MMKPLKKSSLKTRRQFDPVFKRESVQNWLDSGKSAEVVAQELNISPGRLFTWRRLLFPGAVAAKAVMSRAGSPGDLQSQLDAAHRELRHVREQCQILKKTLGILSEPSTNASNGSRR